MPWTLDLASWSISHGSGILCERVELQPDWSRHSYPCQFYDGKITVRFAFSSDNWLLTSDLRFSASISVDGVTQTSFETVLVIRLASDRVSFRRVSCLDIGSSAKADRKIKVSQVGPSTVSIVDSHKRLRNVPTIDWDNLTCSPISFFIGKCSVPLMYHRGKSVSVIRHLGLYFNFYTLRGWFVAKKRLTRLQHQKLVEF